MTSEGLNSLVLRILARLDAGGSRRQLVAICGAPGSGKSTLAGPLVQALSAKGHPAEVVPMDGFHLDNRILESRGILPRKGAPESFDLGGFVRLCQSLRSDDDVYYPLFDRARDIAVAGAGHIGSACKLAVIEGNYLLLDEPGWRDLTTYWDASVRIEVELPKLQRRLVQRWLDHGLAPDAAKARAMGNDIPNARRVIGKALSADITWCGGMVGVA